MSMPCIGLFYTQHSCTLILDKPLGLRKEVILLDSGNFDYLYFSARSAPIVLQKLFICLQICKQTF